MTVGIPSVCSPVGATCDIVEDGAQGFLPRNLDAWEARLTQLLEDAALRRAMGEAGRARAESWYCLEQQAPRLRAAIESALS
jgi:glycosyltransferase involved in cell wall biosynthesis